MRKKTLWIFVFMIILVASNSVFADHCTDCAAAGTPCGRCGYDCSLVNGQCIDTGYRRDNTTSSTSATSGDSTNWWGQATDFWNGSTSSIATEAVENLQPLVNLIKTIGNMIFVAVTVILGVKYIWGGVDSKASIKDSLATLVVAALVFYGWNTISALFMNGNNLSFIASDATTTAKKIYSTVLYIANFFAVGGLVYIGVRYMMAGAEGKSQLKARGVPIVLGIIMVYATITFLNLIVSVI